MWNILILAVVLLDFQKDGVSFTVETEQAQVDPGRSLYLTATLKTPKGKTVAPPDFRARARGFSLAEEYAEEPLAGADGSVTQIVNWKLVPEPAAPVYKIAPFVLGDAWAGPIRFESPAPRAAVSGDYEFAPRKVLPPLSWRLAGKIALGLLAALLAGGLLWWAMRHLVRRVKEHRMSPIERAWAELDRLLKKGLPGRGRYKDFYVELTMVVRRYVQRRYGIRAPHLTTQEFFDELRTHTPQSTARFADLHRFLEAADLVKFAGVQATPEMADDATARARNYLKTDAAEAVREGEKK